MAAVRRTLVFRPMQRGLFRGLFFILLMIVSIYFFLQSSFFNITKIVVVDNVLLSDKEAIHLAGISYNLNMFKLEDDQVRERLMLHPVIRDVKIKRKIPNTLEIKIVERTPSFLVPQKDNFLIIDNTGVCIRKSNTISGLNLPLVTGLDKLSNIEAGQKIDNAKIAKVISLLSNVNSKYKELISEIEIKDNDQIYVYTPSSLEVRLGDGNEVNEKLELLSDALENKIDKKRIVEYVDLSTINSVIKYRN